MPHVRKTVCVPYRAHVLKPLFLSRTPPFLSLTHQQLAPQLLLLAAHQAGLAAVPARHVYRHVRLAGLQRPVRVGARPLGRARGSVASSKGALLAW